MISKVTRQWDIQFNPPLIIVISTLIWATPLYFNKFIWLGDLAVHYQWVTQFHLALSEGVWVPRWAALSHLGLGDPTFLYVHPAYYYVVAFVNFLIGNIWLSIKVVVIIAHLALGLITYWMLKRHISEFLAISCSLFVQWLPIVQFMVFNVQMFPAQLAMPILVGLIGYLGNRENLTYLSIPSIAIMVSLLTLTHILTAFTILVSGSLAIVVLFFVHDKKDNLLKLW